MQNSNRTWAIIIGLIILVLIGVALLQRPQASSSVSTTDTSTATSTTSHDGVTGSGDFTVSGGDTTTIDIPDFRAPIQFSQSISADVKTALQKSAAIVEGRLAKDSLDLKSWIDLGIVRKMGGDYKGAETAWLFVAKTAPTNPIVYNNLGDLYMNFTKEYAKSEKAYLTAIKFDPKNESIYINLYTMYANLYKKGTSAAEDILKKGIAALPDSVNLRVTLARFYKAAGSTNAAKIQYDAAIAAANKAGQTAVATELQAEAAR